MTENCAHECHENYQPCPPCDQLHDLVRGFGSFLKGYADGTAAMVGSSDALAAFDRGLATAAASILDQWQLNTGARPASPNPDLLDQLRSVGECLAVRMTPPAPGVGALDCDLPRDHVLDHQDSHTVPGVTWCWGLGMPAYQLLDEELAGSEDPIPALEDHDGDPDYETAQVQREAWLAQL